MSPSLHQSTTLGTVDQLPEHFRLRVFADDYVEALSGRRQPRVVIVKPKAVQS